MPRSIVLTRRAALRLAATAALALPVLGRAAKGAGREGRVEIDNFTFAPAVVTVPPGATVTWVNRDDIPHTVTATDRAFHSGPLDTDDAFSFTFAAEGEHAYFCSLHPHMTGRIVVRAAGG